MLLKSTKSSRQSRAEQWEVQDHKHPPELVHGGTLCPRIPARGQWSIQGTVHILGEVQQAGKGSTVSLCSCISLVKCHIQLQV